MERLNNIKSHFAPLWPQAPISKLCTFHFSLRTLQIFFKKLMGSDDFCEKNLQGSRKEKRKVQHFEMGAQSIRFTRVSIFLSDFSNLAEYRASTLLNWRKSSPNCKLTVEILIFFIVAEIGPR